MFNLCYHYLDVVPGGRRQDRLTRHAYRRDDGSSGRQDLRESGRTERNHRGLETTVTLVDELLV